MNRRKKLIEPLYEMYNVNTQKELCEKLGVLYHNFNRWYNGKIRNPSEEFSKRLGTELLEVWGYDEVSKMVSLDSVDPKAIAKALEKDRAHILLETVKICSGHLKLDLEELTLLVSEIQSRVIDNIILDSRTAKEISVEILAVLKPIIKT